MRGKVQKGIAEGILYSPQYKEINLIEKEQKKKEINKIKREIDEDNKIEILSDYKEKTTKKDIKDFVRLYNNRLKILRSILKNRQELSSVTSIRKIYSIQPKEQVSTIGIISDIRITKNQNILLNIEDRTGIIKAVITKRNKETFLIAKDLCPDEVIGIQGTKGKGIIFVSSVVLPDIPLNNEFKKAPYEGSMIFISDIHIGSVFFMKKSFEKFLLWLRGEIGNEEQKEEAEKVKYLFIIGDLVEGIGIFPGQDKELDIKDIYQQYEVFSEYINKIPEHIKVIFCPGNHDSVRIAEPQPPISEEMVSSLITRKNTYSVSSPCLLNIGKTDKFSGFNILLYHGYSFPYYASNIDSLRAAGGLESTDKIMTYLLKKRHLAPTHGSTRQIIGYDKDPLVIKQIPDFFVSGHIHRASITNYRNITLMNCSCWITQTDYQEKRGLVPEPARAIYVDFKTRKTKIINFFEKEK